MIVIGLTGGIGMGKSTTARMLRTLNIPVFDADHYIHRALNKNGVAVKKIAKEFPASFDKRGQKINRKALGQVVFKNDTARKKLEAILHPLVRAAEIRFITRHNKKKTAIIVLDIPLLFETGADKLCDVTLCVTAPKDVQRARVLARPGMTEEKFKKIISVQMDDRKRKAKADFVLSTGESTAQTHRDLQTILCTVKRTHARNRP